MSGDCGHDELGELGEHPAGLVCRSCGQVMDREAGESVAAAREAARRERVAARIAEARRVLAESDGPVVGATRRSLRLVDPSMEDHPTPPSESAHGDSDGEAS